MWLNYLILSLLLLFSDLILLLSVCIGHGKFWTVGNSNTAQQVHLPVDLCSLWSGGCGVLGPGCGEVVDCALVWQSGVGSATNIYVHQKSFMCLVLADKYHCPFSAFSMGFGLIQCSKL